MRCTIFTWRRSKLHEPYFHFTCSSENINDKERTVYLQPNYKTIKRSYQTLCSVITFANIKVKSSMLGFQINKLGLPLYSLQPACLPRACAWRRWCRHSSSKPRKYMSYMWTKSLWLLCIFSLIFYFFQSCEKETSLDVIWKCQYLFVLLMFHRSGRKCIRNVKSKTR